VSIRITDHVEFPPMYHLRHLLTTHPVSGGGEVADVRAGLNRHEAGDGRALARVPVQSSVVEDPGSVLGKGSRAACWYCLHCIVSLVSR
jgi:hypothetical protein